MVFQNNVLSGAAGSGTTTYAIDQSIRFDSTSDALMYSPTPSSSKSFTTTATISMWVKLGKVDGTHYLAGGYYGTGGRYELFMLDSSNRLRADGRSGGASASTGTGVTKWTTTQVFRDPSAWYHLVFVYDTTNAVQSERFRLYVNGARVTDFATTPSYGASELVYWFGKSSYSVLGSFWNTTGYADSFYWDGYIAEAHGIDGTALDADNFGEYNSSGIWVPKEYTGSHGTDGFYIKGADASALGTNSAANGNNFTLTNIASHDQMLDSPTNNFAVANPIHASSLIGSGTYAEGNLQVNYGTSIGGLASIAVSSGKWYAEWEIHSGSPTYFVLGIYGDEPLLNTSYAGKFANSYAYYSQDGSYYNNNVSNSYGNSYTVNDVIGIALDLDNNKLYFSKNGTFQNSGDPTSGSTGTGAISITSASSVPLGHYFIAGSSGSSAPTSHTLNYNFGQDGTFAGNVTAGGNSDANGVGNFKYSVPSGYLALCTKNLGS